MKFSKLYAPTLKEAPKDAVLPSHQLLIRAGYIMQIGSGLYNFLPLGKIVLEKIKKVIKEEMDKSGAQEVSLSFVTPSELWEQSHRFKKYGKELLRIKDRKENNFVLSPTNEESIVDLVRGVVTSYKQLPLNLYQIGLKFRDEARPRFGLLRCREFIMKDAYSFHANTQDLKREFDLMEQTYINIFTRLGLNFRVVEADSGAIGGSGSKEFMVLAQNGEDDILVCDSCKYAANIEAAKREKKACDVLRPKSEKMDKFYTPNIKTIDELSKFFNIDKFYTIKAIAKKAIYENEEKAVLFFIRGCDDLQETKALNAAKALELVDISEEELKKIGLNPGFIGPAKLPQDLEFFIDFELENETEMICGANEKDYHIIGFNVTNFKKERFFDLISVQEGDKCPKCGGILHSTKGIEVGHIFQLGQRYSEPMKANFLNEQGKSEPFIMGCYGIGVSRLEAVAVESSFDEKGIIWNKNLSPFDATIIISNMKNEKAVKFANEIYENLTKKGFKILLDDREERFGVKMADYELMGICYGFLIGKDLQNDEVEFLQRQNLSKTKIKAKDIEKVLKEKLC